MKTIDIKGKPYVEVNERIKEFRNNPQYKGYALVSDLIELENGVCTIKAIIKDANGNVIATGFAQEKENSSFINKTSYIENCETSAWGRALGNLGIGIDTSIASADEVLNAIQNQETPKRQNAKKPKSEDDYNNEIDAIANAEANALVCSDCGQTIDKNLHGFSMKNYGKPLCRNCLKNNKRIA